MNTLSLDTFFGSEPDYEKREYLVLGGLKNYKAEFNRKRIYPALGELINLLNSLEEISKQKNKYDISFPKEIKKFDLENKKIIYKSKEESNPKVEVLFELIEWAIPLIKEATEEGIILYDFVEKNLNVEGVGILPIYKDEGYFLIPDLKLEMLQIHQFEVSLFSAQDEKYRALKTKLINTLEMLIAHTPESIKLDLIKKNKELPNPATFFCETDLDFPFEETIFPIAKRKLLTRLAS